MKEEMLAHRFAQRLTSAHAELAMLETKIALLQARRDALRQYIDQNTNLGERLAGGRGAIVDAARAIEAHLAHVSRVAVASPIDLMSAPVETSDESADEVLANEPAKPRRGRPKRATAAATPTFAVSALAETPIKRGRGRPKRQAVAPAVTSTDSTPAAEPVKRGRGRPRSAVQARVIDASTSVEPPKRGRGRPKGSTATTSAEARSAAAGGQSRRKSSKPATTAADVAKSVIAAAAAEAASTQIAPRIAKKRGRKPNQPRAAMFDGLAVLSSRDALDDIRTEGEDPSASAGGAGLEPTPSGDPEPAHAAASVAVDAAPAVHAPVSEMEDAILGVLRDQNRKLIAIGEIADRARKRLGVARLAVTPGHVLEGLRKNGLVERVGHKWRASQNADNLRALFGQ
jgi:hypothetical protein